MMRVGQGFDIHPFSPDPERRLVLAGVELPGPGLAGHSDADDLGTLYPDTDPAYAGADSMALLRRVVLLVRETFDISNVDVTVVLEQPKVAPFRDRMQARLVEMVGAPVNVKAKRGEGLGAIGRKEGVACLAVALIALR